MVELNNNYLACFCILSPVTCSVKVVKQPHCSMFTIPFSQTRPAIHLLYPALIPIKTEAENQGIALWHKHNVPLVPRAPGRPGMPISPGTPSFPGKPGNPLGPSGPLGPGGPGSPGGALWDWQWLQFCSLPLWRMAGNWAGRIQTKKIV